MPQCFRGPFGGRMFCPPGANNQPPAVEPPAPPALNLAESRQPQYPQGLEPPQGAPLAAAGNYNLDAQGFQGLAQMLSQNQPGNPLMGFQQQPSNPFMMMSRFNPLMQYGRGGGGYRNPLMGRVPNPLRYG